MSKLKLYRRREPINIREHDWLYVNTNSIDLIHEVMQGDQYVRTDTIRIPLRCLERALKKQATP